jgi:magnesium chelatase accessory protein
VRNASELHSWPNHDLSRFVQAGGIRWHVQQTGEGPKLLLVHGTGASTHSWRDLIRPLGSQFNVLAADLPGHAFTTQGAAGSSIRAMSESLAVLLKQLQFAPDYVVGHSAGAVILCSLALAGRIVPRVIISINGAFLPLRGLAGMLFSPIAKLLASNTLLPRFLAHRAADATRVERVLLGTGSFVDPRGVELYGRLVRDPTHMAGALRMMADWDLQSFQASLPELHIPLVLIVAENDRAVAPDQAQAVKARVPNAVIVSLPKLGHLAHEEAPATVAAEIIRICAGYPAS